MANKQSPESGDANRLEYIPFEKRYIKYRLINYGQPYKNYTKYILATNTDSIQTIYIDNEPCVDSQTMQTMNEFDLPHYIEIHYLPESGKPKLETIMKSHELDTLISKYIFKV